MNLTLRNFEQFFLYKEAILKGCNLKLQIGVDSKKFQT